MLNQSPLPYAGVSEQSAALTLEQAIHLFRRLAFGADEATLLAAIGRPANVVVEEIIQEALDLPLDAHPGWLYNDDVAIRRSQRTLSQHGVIRKLYQDGFREKMAFFWYDHFGTNTRNHNRPTFSWKALQTYREKGLGDFFDLLATIGKEADMLRFLNGYQSLASAPNENYGRELLELFTMGQNDLDGNSNYTENDIVEISRALTGWQIDNDTALGFLNSTRYDTGVKTIFNQAGYYGYDEVMVLLKEERSQQIAQFIATKIYQFFVYDYPNRFIINKMTTKFVELDFDIAGLLRYILKSKHFHQTAAHGTLIKDPITMHVMAIKESEYSIKDDVAEQGTYRRIFASGDLNGQIVLEPQDVSGWGWARNWISTTTLPNRWDQLQKILEGYYSDIPAQNLVLWAQGACSNSSDPSVIVLELSKRLLSRPANSEMLIQLEDVFKGSIPDEEFENGTWDWFYPEANIQVNNLLSEIYRFPEYHLY